MKQIKQKIVSFAIHRVNLKKSLEKTVRSKGAKDYNKASSIVPWMSKPKLGTHLMPNLHPDHPP